MSPFVLGGFLLLMVGAGYAHGRRKFGARKANRNGLIAMTFLLLGVVIVVTKRESGLPVDLMLGVLSGILAIGTAFELEEWLTREVGPPTLVKVLA